MTALESTANIDMAALPLADGRKIALPLMALAEIQQLRFDEAGDENGGFGTLEWRGLELAISSLDEFCGLEAQSPDQHTTVGVFRGSSDTPESFKALAFCGLASHLNVGADEVKSVDKPKEGHFGAAAEIAGELYLIPDIESLLYKKVTKKKKRS